MKRLSGTSLLKNSYSLSIELLSSGTHLGWVNLDLLINKLKRAHKPYLSNENGIWKNAFNLALRHLSPTEKNYSLFFEGKCTLIPQSQSKPLIQCTINLEFFLNTGSCFNDGLLWLFKLCINDTKSKMDIGHSTQCTELKASLKALLILP